MWFLLIINALYTFFYHLHWTIKKKINLDLAVRYKIIYILQQTWWKIHILSDLCLICRPLLHLCQSWRGSSRVREIIHVYVFCFYLPFICVCADAVFDMRALLGILEIEERLRKVRVAALRYQVLIDTFILRLHRLNALHLSTYSRLLISLLAQRCFRVRASLVWENSLEELGRSQHL